MTEQESEPSPNRDESGRWLVGHNEPGPGRPRIEFKPEYCDIARRFALLGMTDEEMAGQFGVSEALFGEWKSLYPAFMDSIEQGRSPADALVADSLFKQAVGQYVTIDKVVTNAQTGERSVLKVTTYVEGSPHAAQFWLKNRRKADWRDKQDIEHSGSIESTSKEQRDAATKAASQADS